MKAHKEIILTEAVIDSLTLINTGIKNTIPCNGTNSLTPAHINSGVLMGGLSGGVENLAAQATDPCSQDLDFGSLGKPMLDGTAGGAFSGGMNLGNQFPVFIKPTQNMSSSVRAGGEPLTGGWAFPLSGMIFSMPG